jgi:hypothetical protein
VTFSGSCALLKDVAVNSSSVFFVSSGIITSQSCMCVVFLRFRLLPPDSGNSSMHTKPLTGLLEKEKKFENFIIFFDVSQQGLSRVSLQAVHVCTPLSPGSCFHLGLAI